MSLGSLVVEVSANTAAFTSDMGKVAQIAETSMRRAEQAQKIATAASDKFIASLKYQADTFGMTDSAILKYKADLLGAGDAAAPLIARIEQLKSATNSANMANELEKTANSMEHVGFATAGAKRELLVLGHELSQGNFSRFGGSLLVLGERTGAAALLFSGLGLSIIAGAGALAAFAYEVYQGRQAWEALNNAIKTTGDYTGMTAHQLDDMAVHFVSSTKDITMGKEAITALVATGRISGSALAEFGRAAVEMAKDNGQSIEDVAKSLAKLSDGALKWAEDYNKQHHFMTAAQIELAKSLDDEGKQAAATKVVIDALHDAHQRMADDGGKNIGALETWWKEWGVVIDKVKRSIGSVGVPDSNFEKINAKLKERDQIQANMAAADQIRDTASVKRYQALLDRNLATINSLRAVGDAARAKAASDKKIADDADNKDKVLAYIDSGPKSNEAQHAAAIQAENKAYNETLANLDKNSKDYERVVQSHNEKLLTIEDQYRKKSASGISAFNKATLDDQLKPLNLQITAESKLMQDRDKMLDTYYRSDQISIADYYAGKKVAQQEALDNTLKIYDQEIAATQRYIAISTDKTEKLKGETKLKEELANREKAISAAAFNSGVLTEAQTKSAQEYKDQVERLNIQLLQLQGNYEQVAKRQAALQNRQEHATFTVNNDTDSNAKLARLEDESAAVGAIKTQTEAYNLILQNESLVEGRIALIQKSGAISELDALAQTTVARKAQLDQLYAIADAMDAIGDKTPKQVADAAAFRLKIDEMAASADVLSQKFNGIATGAFSTFITDMLSGTKTIATAFKDMAKSIMSEFDKILAKQLSDKLFGDAAGATSGSAGNTSSGFLGTALSWLGMATGIGDAGTGVGITSGDSALSETGAMIAGRRELGGPVMGGSAYLVGEKRPEIFVPDVSGKIIPTDQLGGGRSDQSSQPPNIVIHIHGNNNAPDVRRAAGQGAREALQAFSGAQRYA